MTAPLDPDTLTDARDQAAYWHTRLQAADCSDEERAAFQRWQAASPHHAERYREVVALWQLADRLPAEALRQLGTPAKSPAAAPPQRARRRALGWGLAFVLLATWTGWQFLVPPGIPLYQAALHTSHGQTLQADLPDHTQLTLNTDTVVEVRFSAGERSVALEQGEIFLHVASDAARPFIVNVPDGQVRVTGTRFNVRRENAGFTVAVLEGSVEVRTGPWWRRHNAILGPGNLAQASAGALVVQRRTDVDDALAWRDGRLVLRATPLAAAVRELNRYAARPLAVSGTAATLRVSGVFEVRDIPAFLQALPAIVPVKVNVPPSGPIEIQPL